MYIYRHGQTNTVSRYCKSFVFVPSTHSWTAVILLPQVSPQASLKYLLNLTDLFTVRGHYLYPLLVFMTTSNCYAREQLIHTREQRSSINRLWARHFLTYTSAVGCLVYRFLIQRHKLNWTKLPCDCSLQEGWEQTLPAEETGLLECKGHSLKPFPTFCVVCWANGISAAGRQAEAGQTDKESRLCPGVASWLSGGWWERGER